MKHSEKSFGVILVQELNKIRILWCNKIFMKTDKIIKVWIKLIISKKLKLNYLKWWKIKIQLQLTQLTLDSLKMNNKLKKHMKILSL